MNERVPVDREGRPLADREARPATNLDARSATPDKAIDHVEELLRRDPHDEAGTKGCDALLKHPSVAKRAAEALQDRRRRLAK